MTTETAPRPICVYAAANLRKNSTRLLIAMCIGIALAMYGAYVQIRSHSNPAYAPSIVTAGKMVHKMLTSTWVGSRTLMSGCNSGSGGSRGTFRHVAPKYLMQNVLKPIVHYSGIVNGCFNIIQIILLKVCCRSIRATNGIIALSVVGSIMSMVCMVGAYTTCKVMCISCLGIHHIAIVYLAVRRRKMLMNMLCPAESSSPNNNTLTSSTSISGRIFGPSSASQFTKRSTSPDKARRRRLDCNK